MLVLRPIMAVWGVLKPLLLDVIGRIHSEIRQNSHCLGAQLYDLSGKNRPMREWVEVPIAHEGKWDGLAEEAVYVLGLD